MGFWGTFFGALFGVLAGVASRYLLGKLQARETARRQRKAFVKEMEYNRAVVGELRDEVGRLRNAVNGHVLSTYFGYFAFGRAFFTQANALMNAGTLYQWLDIEHLKMLQRASHTLNPNNENWTNNEVIRRRGLPAAQFDQTELVRFVDYVAGQIEEADRSLKSVIAAVS